MDEGPEDLCAEAGGGRGIRESASVVGNGAAPDMILASNFDANHPGSLLRKAVLGGVDYQLAQDQTQTFGLNCGHETLIGDGFTSDIHRLEHRF